jgi:hypothetical protein
MKIVLPYNHAMKSCLGSLKFCWVFFFLEELGVGNVFVKVLILFF